MRDGQIQSRRAGAWIAGEIVAIVAGMVITYLLARRFDAVEQFIDWSRRMEDGPIELDELPVVAVFLAVALMLFSMRRWRELRREIVRRERIDERGRRRDAHFRALVQNAFDVVVVHDATGVITFVSSSSARILGYQPEQWIGRNAFEVVHPEDKPALFEALRRVVSEPPPHQPIEFRLRHADGRWRVFETQANNLLGDPNVRGIVQTARDVTERRQTEAALRESEATNRAIVDAIPDILAQVSGDGTVLMCQAAPEVDLLLTPEMVIGRRLDEVLPAPPAKSALTVIDRALRQPGTHITEHELVIGDASRTYEARWVACGEDRVVVFARDITEQRRQESELRHAEARYRRLFEEAPVMYAIADNVNGEPVIADCNALFSRVLGYERAEVMGRSLADFYTPASQAAMRGGGYQRALHGRFTVEERQLVQRDGRVIETLLQAMPEQDADRAVLGTRMMFVDITDRKRLEEELRSHAINDALTGLPNRTLFRELLEHALNRSRANGRRVAVLFLDLDGFKLVNDSLGHAAGDTLLCRVAERLGTKLRGRDTLARFSGDEFTVLIEDVDGPWAALTAAEELLESLADPFLVDGHEVFVMASIGVAISDRGLTEADVLVRQADTALHQAKLTGKARTVLFRPEMARQVEARLVVATDLRRAIEREELTLAFQPEVALDGGGMIGVEALVRWQHPVHGPMSPAEFIPLAEETGLIVPLGLWVLETACRQARAWQNAFPDMPLVISVNVSTRQLAQASFPEQVRAVLDACGLEANRLCLEVTETAIMADVEAARLVLEELAALGVQLAVDDFGTGYSSLSYLQQLPVDVIKVDRSFVQELERSAGTMQIVRAVTTLAHALGMGVVAEGVETAEQSSRVELLGCDSAQGYFFARPQPAEQVAALLAAGGRIHPPMPLAVGT